MGWDKPGRQQGAFRACPIAPALKFYELGTDNLCCMGWLFRSTSDRVSRAPILLPPNT